MYSLFQRRGIVGYAPITTPEFVTPPATLHNQRHFMLYFEELHTQMTSYPTQLLNQFISSPSQHVVCVLQVQVAEGAVESGV